MVKNMLALAAIVLLMGTAEVLADASGESPQKMDHTTEKTTHASTDAGTTSTNDKESTQTQEKKTTQSTDTTSGDDSASDASKGQCIHGVDNKGKDCDKVGYAPMKGLGAVWHPMGTSVPLDDKTINSFSEAIAVPGLAHDNTNQRYDQCTSNDKRKPHKCQGGVQVKQGYCCNEWVPPATGKKGEHLLGWARPVGSWRSSQNQTQAVGAVEFPSQNSDDQFYNPKPLVPGSNCTGPVCPG